MKTAWHLTWMLHKWDGDRRLDAGNMARAKTRSPIFFERLAHRLANTRARMARNRRRRAAVRELMRLPDHVLADIGIERHQIREVVDGLSGAAAEEQNERPPTNAEEAPPLGAAARCCAHG